jgi:two-component system, OmpR family, response regulator MtrA
VKERILLVEDDDAVATVLRDALRDEGYEVEHVATGEDALERSRSGRPDLVVLDWMLPDISGLDVCSRLRAESGVSIIMLTAKGDEASRVRGLELGADDYVTKPFSLAELASRVRAQLRRRALPTASAKGAVQAIGWLHIDYEGMEVLVDGRPVSLTPSEFRILMLLSQQPGRVFSRREIMRHVWHSTHAGDSRAADSHVVTLRRKIEKDPQTPSRLLTVRGTGYKLVA